ncbi:YfiT family bacillithiol transferase [Croceiramulus getboli]|nr:putative metal-dependent hydrolase [Flavobacteriaceae bacterium YJPT1-3]
MSLEKERYPIGKFQVPTQISQQDWQGWKQELASFPEQLTHLVSNLTPAQLDTPYREGGWTVRQVVHHLADSHHHSYIRFKWALTEDNPVIKPYDEKAWAQLPDVLDAPIELSLEHLRIVHKKLVHLLDCCSQEHLKRSFIHPDGQVKTTLLENTGRYAWHGRHHYTHILNLLTKRGWRNPST